MEVRGNVDSSGLPNGESTLDRNSNGVSVENSEKLEEGPSGKLPIEVIQEDGFVSFVSIEPVARGGGDGGAIGLIIEKCRVFPQPGGPKRSVTSGGVSDCWTSAQWRSLNPRWNLTHSSGASSRTRLSPPSRRSSTPRVMSDRLPCVS